MSRRRGLEQVAVRDALLGRRWRVENFDGQALLCRGHCSRGQRLLPLDLGVGFRPEDPAVVARRAIMLLARSDIPGVWRRGWL